MGAIPAPSQSKINNVQALRAFAALAVVVYHTGFTIPGAHSIGAFGVDVFFIISGYMMARICDINPAFFFRRRIIRIVPPYWALTLLLFAFATRFPSLLSSTRPDWRELLQSLFFIPFFKSPGTIQPILFVGWTLNYEMFFYAAVTLGLIFLRRRPLLFATAFLFAVAALSHQFGRGYAIPRFLSSGLLVEFPLGALAYSTAKGVSALAAKRFRLLSALVVVAFASFLVYAQAVALHRFVPIWSMTAVASFLLCLGAVLLSKGGWDTQLRWVVLAGDASYMLYLVHPYCINLLRHVVARHVRLFDITHLFGSLFAVLLSLVIAIALHLKCELPMVAFLNKRFGGHRPSANSA